MQYQREICAALDQVNLASYEAVNEALEPLGLRPLDMGPNAPNNVVYADNGYTYVLVNGTVETGPSWVDAKVSGIEVDDRIRFHLPDVAPNAIVDPTAQIHPTARIESDANIGNGAIIGPYAHLSRGVIVGADSVIAEGVSIGYDTVISPRSTIAQGADVGSRAIVGHDAHVGRAATIQARAEVAPEQRVPTRGKIERRPGNPYRATQIANAVDRLLQIDR